MLEQGAHSFAKAGVVEGTEAAAEVHVGAGAGVEEECSFLYNRQCQAGRQQAAHLRYPPG